MFIARFWHFFTVSFFDPKINRIDSPIQLWNTYFYMKIPKELTRVTPLSRTVAFVVIIALPILAFFFGLQYQSQIDSDTIALLSNSPVATGLKCSANQHTVCAPNSMDTRMMRTRGR